jgi:ubiquinone/menaquinone biosynthesis C-methylase UbiE
MTRDKHQSNADFKLMAFTFKLRDIFKPPIKKIERATIKEDDVVLDYGCGSGSYTFAASETVGKNGRVYAADINPAAIKTVENKARKKGFSNIVTILTDCKTTIESGIIDKVLCFDVFHDISDKTCVLSEFHRVLKSDGMLCFDDHHLKELELLEHVTKENLFKLKTNKEGTYLFSKYS